MYAIHINSVLRQSKCSERTFDFTTLVSAIDDMTISKVTFRVGTFLLVLE